MSLSEGIGLDPAITGGDAFNARNETDVAIDEPTIDPNRYSFEPLPEVVDAEPTLSPYDVLSHAFEETNKGNDLLRVKVKRKTKRHVQVLTDNAKDLSELFVNTLFEEGVENLDKETLLAEVDKCYQQLIEAGHNHTAAYRLKQSATFKIHNRFNPVARLFQRKDQAIIPPVIITSDDEILPLTTSKPGKTPARFSKIKEIGRRVASIGALGIALLGFADLTFAKKADLPVANFAKPTPIVQDFRVGMSPEDQIRAEQRYFSSLPLPTATTDPANYPPVKTGSNNPESPKLELMQGNMTVSFKYPDGSKYTYGNTVGIEDTQDFSQIEPGEELAPKKLNGLRIVKTDGVPVVACHQKWNGEEGPCANFSDKAKEVGDDNLKQLTDTTIDFVDQDGNALSGSVTGIELLDSDDANPIFYQSRVKKGLNGFHIITCHRQDAHGTTYQWLWITIAANGVDPLPPSPSSFDVSMN